MEKSRVTEALLQYFENYGIDVVLVSRKTGIDISKLSRGYKQPLTAAEFLTLCVYLKIEPEEILKRIRNIKNE